MDWKDRVAQIQWRQIFLLLPFTAVGVLTGLYLFKTVDSIMLAQYWPGCLVLLYAMYNSVRRNEGTRVSGLWAIPVCSGRGLVGTLFGTGGPFYAVYLKHLRTAEDSSFRPLALTVFLMDGAGRLTGISQVASSDRDWLVLAAFPLPVAYRPVRRGHVPPTSPTDLPGGGELPPGGHASPLLLRHWTRVIVARILRLKPGGGRALNQQ